MLFFVCYYKQKITVVGM